MAARNYISAIERTMRVLESFNGEGAVSLAGLASRTGLVKSSVFRILFTLQQLGYVEKNAAGQYSINFKLSRMAGDPRPTRDLVRLSVPLMSGLVGRFQETVNLGVLDAGEVLYVHVIESPHAFRLAAHAGMRSPVHSTALGKCLLSSLSSAEIDRILKKHPLRSLTSRTVRDRASLDRELKRVRARGYAIDHGEDSAGARCLGAPILGDRGGAVAAISISGPASRVHVGRDRELVAALIDACRQISTLLNYTAPEERGAGGR